MPDPFSNIDISQRKIWQVAAGDTDRNYVAICLTWDVILNGPGILESQKVLTSKKLTDIKRFNKDISDGDIVVLRLGTSEVHAVGITVGEPLWLDDFGDIDGWDLQLVRRVKWVWKNSGSLPPFPPYTLKLGDTVQSLDSQVVIDWLKTLQINQLELNRELVTLPATCIHDNQLKRMELSEISDYLFDEGVAAGSIDSLTHNISEFIRIAGWYQRTDEKASESETITYLVAPLLLALGWTPQKMAIEWNNVDIALFERVPRSPDVLSIVVEAKKKGNSCLSARSQAEDYAEKPGRENCRRLIVTDGLRYGIYVRNVGGKFPDSPSAYLNLTRMLDSYPILECKGAKEALLLMSADWNEVLP